MLAAITLVAVSCTKEQRSVNKLEGTWTLDKIEENDGSVTVTDNDPNGEVTFNKCKLAKDEFCTYSSTISYEFNGNTFEFSDAGEYRVQDDEIQFREDAEDNSYDVATIEELKNKELVVYQAEDEGYTRLYYIK
ncbi:Lipocalin-like domain-containing protein [Lishizhenia tianjinensis]|uniref:Lipocalin-like domain-containing protein n=2 Tax=Lishizhenia tianjinensis TaxID=477690 RepID=A0A1I6ZSW0_9FLAO|nr:Lipocalin-like domain-containing protein [Lishizhenia tianjinensis]